MFAANSFIRVEGIKTFMSMVEERLPDFYERTLKSEALQAQCTLRQGHESLSGLYCWASNSQYVCLFTPISISYSSLEKQTKPQLYHEFLNNGDSGTGATFSKMASGGGGGVNFEIIYKIVHNHNFPVSHSSDIFARTPYVLDFDPLINVHQIHWMYICVQRRLPAWMTFTTIHKTST